MMVFFFSGGERDTEWGSLPCVPQGSLPVSTGRQHEVRRVGDWGGGGKLRAKAAATRHLSRFVLELYRELNSGSKGDRIRLKVCELPVRVCLMLYYDDQLFKEPII